MLKKISSKINILIRNVQTTVVRTGFPIIDTLPYGILLLLIRICCATTKKNNISALSFSEWNFSCFSTNILPRHPIIISYYLPIHITAWPVAGWMEDEWMILIEWKWKRNRSGDEIDIFSRDIRKIACWVGWLKSLCMDSAQTFSRKDKHYYLFIFRFAKNYQSFKST